MIDAFNQPQSIVVLGGTSDIAATLVGRVVAGRHCRSAVLAGRNLPALEAAAAVLGSDVSRVHTVQFDATRPDTAPAAVTACFDAAGEPVDLVVLAVGELGDPLSDEADPGRVASLTTVNFTWPAAALTAVAERLRRQGRGRIVVLSSVAGVRVRRANYVYGADKAGLDAFTIGLSEALRGSGVSVHIVRPGFVHTKMTEGLPAAPFSVGPERVAADVVRGLGRGDTVIWSPGILRWVFGVFRLLPQSVWRRLPG